MGKFTVFVVCCVQVSISAPHGLGEGGRWGGGGGGLERDSLSSAYTNRSFMSIEFACFCGNRQWNLFLHTRAHIKCL